MKAIFCGACFDIRALDPDCAWVECRCGNMKAKWLDPHSGTVTVKAKNRSMARMIGLNNMFLQAAFRFRYDQPATTSADWKTAHQLATIAPGYIFDEAVRGCWACIIQVGQTNDISWEPDPPKPVPEEASGLCQRDPECYMADGHDGDCGGNMDDGG